MWNVRTIQVVWFTSGGDASSAEVLYLRAFEVEPDLAQRNRQLGATNRFLSVAEGIFDGMKCVVQVQPGRVDFHLGVSDTDVDIDAPIKSLPLEAVRLRVRGLIDRITGEIQNVHRLAHVGSYLIPVDGYDEAARRHFAMTGMNFPDAGLSDLLFQVNRKMSTAGVYEINRLVRLAVLAEHSLFVNVGQVAEGVEAYAPKYGLSLVLDFNTVPVAVPISVEDQRSIFDELMVQTDRFVSAGNPIEVLKENA